MLIQKYLIINSRGQCSARNTLGRLQGHEIALHLEIEVPDKLFERPILEARMSVPEEAVPYTKIDTVVQDNIEHLIKEVTGLDLIVRLVETEKENI